MNKVNSKATLRWNVLGSPSLSEEIRARFVENFGKKLTAGGDIVIVSSEARDQTANIESCIEKLRRMLAQVATRPKKRKKTKPTRASKERRLNTKKLHSQTKRLRQVKSQE